MCSTLDQACVIQCIVENNENVKYIILYQTLNILVRES